MAARSSARELILDAAERLVLDRGFAATTVDAVLAAAGASKGAFFHHFPSKLHLGRALVTRYAERDAEVLESLLTAAEKESADPGEQVLAFARRLEAAAGHYPQGAEPNCLFVSFIYENELDDEETSKIIVGAILHWRERILAKLDAAAESRPALREVDLPSLADQVFTTFEGAFLLGRALGDADQVRAQLAHLRRYLELLLAPRS